MELTAHERAELGKWAAAHGLRWEVHALTRAERGRVHRVGYEIQVTCPAVDLQPACPQCLELHRRVTEVAELAVAGAHAEACCHVRPFEPVLRLRPTTGELEPEIEVAIEVVVPEDEALEAEARVAHEVECRLQELGVRHH